MAHCEWVSANFRKILVDDWANRRWLVNPLTKLGVALPRWANFPRGQDDLWRTLEYVLRYALSSRSRYQFCIQIIGISESNELVNKWSEVILLKKHREISSHSLLRRYVHTTSYVVNIPRGAKQVMGLLGGVLASLGKWPALKHSRIQCERIGFDDDNKHKQAQKASGSFGPRSRF